MTNRITRLAPSPTGALHLGNARSFLINWAIARNRGWRLLMRIEDLDGPRVKAAAAKQAIDILTWLGMDSDNQPIYQSSDLSPYRRAMHQIARIGRTFSCELTRKEIEQAVTAPHRGEHENRYPPSLRPVESARYVFANEDTNYRLAVDEDERVTIDDDFAGRAVFNPSREIGDFVIWTKRGVPAYQLAVVVDDAGEGITDVIRGDDLLESAARQTLIYRALDLPTPRWMHLPLVLGPDGRRLAKRHGDTRIVSYREAGVEAERIIGLLAAWSGIVENPTEMSAEDFRREFVLEKLPPQPVTFTQKDHLWLLQVSS